MKALFHTGVEIGWWESLGRHPWCLAPAGGKPLVEYWLEWAAEVGASDVRLLLGEGGEHVEAFCADGSRWGLKISYGFIKQGADPVAFLRRSPAQWEAGLLYIAGPVFPRRPQEAADNPGNEPLVLDPHGAWLLPSGRNGAACFLSSNADSIRAFIAGQSPETRTRWDSIHVEPFELDAARSYYELNMQLVQGDIARYVRPGFGGGDAAYIGSNVSTPPSVVLRPPLIIGNDCRIHPMAVIGPNAVIGNGVIVDRQTEVSDSVVLDNTYLGRTLEIKGRIVSGTRLVLPEDGTVVEIADPWLLAQLQARTPLVDAVRATVGWIAAVALLTLQAAPFALLYLLLRIFGGGRYIPIQRLVAHARVRRLPVWSATSRRKWLNRLFSGLSLDVFPLLALVVPGSLWLCGHEPLHPEHDTDLLKRLRRYYPAVMHYGCSGAEDGGRRSTAATNALYYERYRSLLEDVRILLRFLVGRLMAMLASSSQDVQQRQTS